MWFCVFSPFCAVQDVYSRTQQHVIKQVKGHSLYITPHQYLVAHRTEPKHQTNRQDYTSTTKWGTGSARWQQLREKCPPASRSAGAYTQRPTAWPFPSRNRTDAGHAGLQQTGVQQVCNPAPPPPRSSTQSPPRSSPPAPPPLRQPAAPVTGLAAAHITGDGGGKGNIRGAGGVTCLPTWK